MIIRTIITAIVCLILLILAVPFYLLTLLVRPFSKLACEKFSLLIVKVGFRIATWFAGARVKVTGRENIPDDQPVLYVANHRSIFDILCGYPLVKRTCGFTSKVELERIPLVSWYMKHMHCVFLERDNIKQQLGEILKCIKYIKEGASIWIFPEGTRSQDKNVLLPFKEGSMKIASKTGCLIIPVAITGTDDVWENHFPWVRKTKVTYSFGKPIDLKTLSKEDQKFPGAYVQREVERLLGIEKDTLVSETKES